MSYLRRRAAAFASPYPVASWRPGAFWLARLVVVIAIIVVGLSFMLATSLFADDAVAPAGGDLLSGVISLWGPTCGILVAIILFFDRLAKVIPNTTTSSILSVLRKVATVLGVKVPDVQ